jgi:hypothetical protein
VVPIKSEKEFNECMRVLESDLRTLRRLIITHRKPVAEGDIRAASVILRKWIVEDLLGHVCNIAQVKPTVVALDTEEVCKALVGHPLIDYFLAGGVACNGHPVVGLYHAKGRSTGSPLIPVDKMMRDKDLSLGEFRKQKRLYFNGTFFSCENIIKYMANKLGGAHLSFSRAGTFEKLERAAAYLTYGGPPVPKGEQPPTPVYLVLEPDSTEVLTGLHIEIVAAAASLIRLKIDGVTVYPIEFRKSLRTRIRKLVDRKKSPFRFIDFEQ